MSFAWKSRLRKHRSARILPDEIRETPSLPVRRVRKDVLCDQGHAVLPSPASASYFRHGRRSQSRGRQHFRDCSDRRDCLEHRRSLARARSPSVSSIQPQKDRRVRRRGATGGRDSLFRRRENAANMDFRGDRSLVSALAIDSDRKTKLPKHARSAARRRRPDGFRASSLDRHRRIRFLREGRPSCLWSSGSVRSGAQDAKKRSYRESRTKRADGAVRRPAQQLRGLVDLEHVVH